LSKNKWQAQIPSPLKNKERKRCYVLWKALGGYRFSAGGKIVWLTDKEKTFYQIKHPTLTFEEVLEKDSLALYKKYMHHTIDNKFGY
jgi:hypothetical protein